MKTIGLVILLIVAILLLSPLPVKYYQHCPDEPCEQKENIYWRTPIIYSLYQEILRKNARLIELN